MSDQDKLMKRMAAVERALWFVVLPGGPFLILAGLWLASNYGAMPPVQPYMAGLWDRVEIYYWVATGGLLAAGAWVRWNLYTPEALRRMKLPPNQGMPMWFSVEGLDEHGRQRMELWRKLISRNFLLLGLIDAPVIILIGLYMAVEFGWFLEFGALYSVVAALLFRPTSTAELVDAAAKLSSLSNDGAIS